MSLIFCGAMGWCLGRGQNEWAAVWALFAWAAW